MTEIDKAKAYLGQAYRIDLQIASKEEQIRMWASLAEKVTVAIRAAGGSAGSESRVEEYAIRIADAQTFVRDHLILMYEAKRDLTQRLGQDCKTLCTCVLLEQRYLAGKKWDDVADFMGYTTVYIKKMLYPAALKEFSEILKKATKCY